MKILFCQTAADAFSELPEPAKRHAAILIDLIEQQPEMFPIRRRGLMRGYRYFIVGRHLFYYSLSSDEGRIVAILPGAMRKA